MKTENKPITTKNTLQNSKTRYTREHDKKKECSNAAQSLCISNQGSTNMKWDSDMTRHEHKDTTNLKNYRM